MSALEAEILMTAVTVGAACALPGVFLVLRRLSMLTDAISHTILLGIVLAFLVVEQYGHPLLVIGASAVGVLTVFLIELVKRTGLVKEDAAIGITFPALFSLGVLLIALFARNAHLDEHMVFQGDLVYSVFERLEIAGVTLGPLTLWKMLGVLVLNLVLLLLFYRELKITTFDPALATSLGISASLVHYGLIAMTSFTAVGAFDSVGSILVIGFMIIPPVTARLLTDRLAWTISLSVVLGAVGAMLGFFLAAETEASIGGAMALVMGVLFLLALIGAPRKGIVAGWLRRRQQRTEFAVRMLVIHLWHHRDVGDRAEENRRDHLHAHLGWSVDFGERIVRLTRNRRLLELRDDAWMVLTERGREYARRILAA